MRRCSTPREFALARKLLRRICALEGWIGAERFLAEYVNPLRSCVFFVGDGRDVVGALVLAERELPLVEIEAAWPNLRVAGAHPVELALFGVDPAHRRRAADVALIAEMARHAARRGITDYYAILDERRMRYFKSLGIPFAEIPLGDGGGRHEYWGEICFPARLPREAGEEFLRHANPWMWDLVEGGW